MIRYAKLACRLRVRVWLSVWVALVCESMVWLLAFWYVSDGIYGVVVTIGRDNSFPCSRAVDLKNETSLGEGSAYVQRWTRLSEILPE